MLEFENKLTNILSDYFVAATKARVATKRANASNDIGLHIRANEAHRIAKALAHKHNLYNFEIMHAKAMNSHFQHFSAGEVGGFSGLGGWGPQESRSDPQFPPEARQAAAGAAGMASATAGRSRAFKGKKDIEKKEAKKAKQGGWHQFEADSKNTNSLVAKQGGWHQFEADSKNTNSLVVKESRMQPYPKSPEEVAMLISEDVSENRGLLTEEQLQEADPMSRRGFLRTAALGAAGVAAGAAGAGAPAPAPAPAAPGAAPAAVPAAAAPEAGPAIPEGPGKYRVHFKVRDKEGYPPGEYRIGGSVVECDHILRHGDFYYMGIGHGPSEPHHIRGGSRHPMGQRPPELWERIPSRKVRVQQRDPATGEVFEKVVTHHLARWKYPRVLTFNPKNVDKVEKLA